MLEKIGRLIDTDVLVVGAGAGGPLGRAERETPLCRTGA